MGVAVINRTPDKLSLVNHRCGQKEVSILLKGNVTSLCGLY